MSLEPDSTIWLAAMLSVSTRVWRYSSLADMLLWKVMSMPMSGENCSLIDTVLMSYIDDGVGSPVCTSSTKP